LTVSIGVPEPTAEKFELYGRYTTQWHGKSPGEEGQDLEGRWETFESFLYDSPVDTLEFCYRDPTGRLLAVGICDVCPQSLSSVYFYFDPADARRGLGTFGAVYEIEFARAKGMPHYYLGYWVAGCAAMQYKSTFRPCEILDTDGEWRMLDDAKSGPAAVEIRCDPPHRTASLS